MVKKEKNSRNDIVNPKQGGGRSVKKGGFVRKLMIFIAVVCVAALAWLAFILFGNNFKSNAMGLKVNATVASRLAGVMLRDYIDNWARVEMEQLAKNAEGLIVSTNDPQKVIEWRQEFFKKNGCADALDKLVEDIEAKTDDMGLIPAKYRDTKDLFKELKKNVKDLALLTKQPGDSLVGMAVKMGELQEAVANNIEATDFNFYVSPEDVMAKVDEMAAGISDKDIVEALGKEVDGKANSIINVLKYKKLGFKELPKGKGVLYNVITKGKGPKPKDDNMVKLNYEGKLMDGTVFDSSYNRGQPAVMRPSQTVPGFWHSLTSMPMGSKWEIYILYDQAYGNRAAGQVKPYSDLFFTIETIAITE